MTTNLAVTEGVAAEEGADTILGVAAAAEAAGMTREAVEGTSLEAEAVTTPEGAGVAMTPGK